MKFLKHIAATLVLAFVTAAQACTPVTLQPGIKGLVCWGDKTWPEAINGGKIMSQSLNFFASPNNPNAPLLMYFHPNGGNIFINQAQNPSLYAQIVQPALAAGYAVAAIEFRHPVENDNVDNAPGDPRVPHWDAARAIQYMRYNAANFGIDKRNIVVAAQSRGTLSLWTALQDDMADPNASDPISHESTRVRALWVYQGQTSYNPVEYSDWFLVPGDRAQAESDFETLHPKWTQFGSAADSATADDPPVHLNYKQQFVKGFITYQTMLTQFNPEHYPDYGVKLCQQYTLVNNPNECTAQQNIPEGSGWNGMIPWLNKYLIP